MAGPWAADWVLCSTGAPIAGRAGPVRTARVGMEKEGSAAMHALHATHVCAKKFEQIAARKKRSVCVSKRTDVRRSVRCAGHDKSGMNMP